MVRTSALLTIAAVAASANSDCVGHRGFSGKYPENTILALREAILAGGQGIETDLMVSKDDVVFLMHDTSLARTTNCTGRASLIDGVYDVNWNGYLEYCNADYNKNPTEPTKIPQFADLLRLLQEFPEAYVLLDMKNGTPLKSMSIMRDVFDSPEFKDYDFTKQVYVAPWVLDPYVKEANAVLGEFPTSLIHSTLPNPEAGVDSFNINHNRITRDFVDKARQLNKQVFGWTINSISDMQNAFNIGLNGVLTDNVEDCVGLQQKFQVQAEM